mmetsp:Transcript_13515/g.18686  ORF Transcript_13515/g.18686 Transcript_13515/m.18686 type:complete len:197 (-) Transcript_13515:594-1184(-)
MFLARLIGTKGLGLGAGVIGTALTYYATQQSTPVSAENEPQRAVAILRGEPGNEQVAGVVRFTQIKPDRVKIEADIKGLKKGLHGFHIHQWGDLTNGCTSAGPHYNPFKKNHGGPQDQDRHVGDMGNITVINDGENTKLVLEDTLIQLEGPYSVIGRAVVVHADEDDLGKGGFSDSKTTGHAGARVACGVIGKSNN